MVFVFMFTRNFKKRKSVFEKGSFKDNQEKEKWRSVMCLEFMSSDESGIDEDKEVIISHPLPWLSPSVQQLKKKLDDASFKNKSPQAKRMIKERVVGTFSSRPKPTNDTVPSWVFN